jgi:LacI family transcriptional regulator
MMKSRATVIDVAAAAGVGASTVSRFLRGVPVRPELSERIASAITTLGYEPDQTARSLRGGRSRTIGVLFPKVSVVYFSQALQCVEHAARKRDYTVAFLSHGDSLSMQQQSLITLRGCRAEGVILTAAPGTTLDDIQATLPGIPVVALENFFSPEVDSILLQNRQSARQATEHLLEHGYASVSCVAARPNVFSYQERVSGYADAMSGYGLKPHVLMARDFDHLIAMLRERFRTGVIPQALLALSDVAAAHVLTVCRELNVPAERRPKMIAYDDFEFAPLLQVPMTVVRQPIAGMIHAAMESLFRQIDGGSNYGTRTLSMPGELVIRQSCGCQ